jgi:copper homeostasis protein
MPGCGISERNFDYIKETLKAKEYHVFLPKVTPSKMEYRPDHIYMGGVLRQEEFSLAKTSSSRVKDITGSK